MEPGDKVQYQLFVSVNQPINSYQDLVGVGIVPYLAPYVTVVLDGLTLVILALKLTVYLFAS